MAVDQTAALRAMQEDSRAEDADEKRIRSNVFKMIDQGTGTIEDLWAPPRMKLLSDYIELGDEALGVCTVSNWPTELSYGWLNQLLEDSSLTDVKIDASIHIHPVRKEYALSFMQDKKVSAESSKAAEMERGKKNDKAQRVYDAQIDTATMMYEMLDGNPNENLYQVSVVFGVYGHVEMATDEATGERYVEKDAKEDLVEKMDRFKKALAKNSKGGFAIKPLLHQQREGIKSLLPWGYGGLHSFQNLYTSALATCYPFTHGQLQVEDGILYGINPWTQQPYFFNSFNRHWTKAAHTICIGSTGSGKSETVKALLGRYAIMGTQIFVVDPAINAGESEYGNLATSLDGKVIDFGGKSGVSMNPFELQPPTNWQEIRDPKKKDEQAVNIYKQKKEYLIGLFDIMRNIYVKENGIANPNLAAFSKVMNELIDRVYQYKSINITRGSWDFRQWQPQFMPTMSDLYFLLTQYENIVETFTDRDKLQGWAAHALDRRGNLINRTSEKDKIYYGYWRSVTKQNSRLWGASELEVIQFASNFVEEYAQKQSSESYSEKASLFASDKKADLSGQCIVFRFGNVSETMKQIATYLTFELIYSRITAYVGGKSKFHNYIVAMDECWKLLSSEYARNYVVRMAREGRKLSTGLWIISQKYSDFEGKNRVLFDQAETKIILSLSDDEVTQLTDDIDLSPTLADTINGDKKSVTPGLGILHIAGKKKMTVAFYCQLSKMELAIGDTTNSSTKPPLKAEDIINFGRRG